MSKKRDEADDVTGTLGTYAVGGAPLVGARALGGLISDALGEGRRMDLGPAPIGSDPWLTTEIQAALSRASIEADVHVQDAAVTIRVANDETGLADRAARTVQGIKKLTVTKR